MNPMNNNIPHSDPYMARQNFLPMDNGKSKVPQYINPSDVGYDDYGAQDYVNDPPNGVPRKSFDKIPHSNILSFLFSCSTFGF